MFALRLQAFALLLAGSLAVAGCDEHGHDHSAAIGPATESKCPSVQTLTYDNFGRGFIQTYCARCHASTVTGAARKGAPADHTFDDIHEIRGLAHHIDQYAASGPAATNTAMPKDDPRPSLEERRKLGEWLACGSP
jgi:cytochrome c5